MRLPAAVVSLLEQLWSEIGRSARSPDYRGSVIFVALGIATMLLYAVATAWMAALARREPGRRFQIGKYGRIKSREVTAAEWIRRYAPWGLGCGLLITLLGLFVISRTP